MKPEPVIVPVQIQPKKSFINNLEVSTKPQELEKVVEEIKTCISRSESPIENPIELNLKPLEVRALSDIERQIQHKLSYEWKNIYRNLLQLDPKETEIIDIYDFDRICLRYKINFSKEELRKIARVFRH